MHKKILILDDDPGIRKAIKHTLDMSQFQVTCATTADEATQHVHTQHFDLILVDFAMPKHDGKWFMQNTRIPHKTKVILITGFADREIINAMFSLGVCGYLIKPVDEDMLLHNICFYLGIPEITEPHNRVDAPAHEQTDVPVARAR